MPRMPTHRMPTAWVPRVGSPTPPEARLLSLSGVRRAPTGHAARGALGRTARTAGLPFRTRPATERPRRRPRHSTAPRRRPCGLRRPAASRGGADNVSPLRRTRASKALDRGPGRAEQILARPRGAPRSRRPCRVSRRATPRGTAEGASPRRRTRASKDIGHATGRDDDRDVRLGSESARVAAMLRRILCERAYPRTEVLTYGFERMFFVQPGPSSFFILTATWGIVRDGL